MSCSHGHGVDVQELAVVTVTARPLPIDFAMTPPWPRGRVSSNCVSDGEYWYHSRLHPQIQGRTIVDPEY